jgi:hypothetical protein
VLAEFGELIEELSDHEHLLIGVMLDDRVYDRDLLRGCRR